jgi:hypothetical protein
VWQACRPRQRQPPAGRFQEERWNYERTDFGLADRRERRLNHPEFKANTHQPGVYKNEYKDRAILVCLEAGGADSPVRGAEFTVARRSSSGRGRSPVEVVASSWGLETSDTAPLPCAKIETSARLQGLQPRLCHGEPTVTRSSH